MTSLLPGDVIHGAKATGSDGLSFSSGYTVGRRIDYAAAVGQTVEVDAAPYDDGQCAAGIHFSLRGIDCCRVLGRMDPRPWRFFEVAVAVEDIAWPRAEDIAIVDKLRARRVYVVREMSVTEALGFDLTERTKRCREITATFKAIPWINPAHKVEVAEVEALLSTWRERMAPYARPPLPSAVRLVRTREEARTAAAAAADDDAADDAAIAAATADDAADDAADAADAAATAADDAADAADAATADDDDDDATDAATADDDDDDATAAAAWLPWLRWYVRPWYVLRRHARWAFTDGADPFAPLVELYRLGCLPIGFVRGEFVVWAPEVRK